MADDDVDSDADGFGRALDDSHGIDTHGDGVWTPSIAMAGSRPYPSSRHQLAATMLRLRYGSLSSTKFGEIILIGAPASHFSAIRSWSS